MALVEHRFSRGRASRAPADARLPRRSSAATPRLLEQALVNLLLNACDACERGGHVTVRVEVAQAHATFAVIDDGAGISPGDAARVARAVLHHQAAGTRAPGSGSPSRARSSRSTAARSTSRRASRGARARRSASRRQRGRAMRLNPGPACSWSTTTTRWPRCSPRASATAATTASRWARARGAGAAGVRGRRRPGHRPADAVGRRLRASGALARARPRAPGDHHDRLRRRRHRGRGDPSRRLRLPRQALQGRRARDLPRAAGSTGCACAARPTRCAGCSRTASPRARCSVAARRCGRSSSSSSASPTRGRRC